MVLLLRISLLGGGTSRQAVRVNYWDCAATRISMLTDWSRRFRCRSDMQVQELIRVKVNVDEL